MNLISINPIVYLVITTFIVGLLFLNKTSLNNKVLFYILLNYFLTEVVSVFLNYNSISVGFLYNISICLQFIFWLIILTNALKKQILSFVLAFTMISGLTMIFKFIEFNNYIFFIGSIIYLLVYFSGNINLLKKENIDFFLTREYFLISIPLIFFIGMSFLFSYNSGRLTSTTVFFNISLYKFINYFVNIIYYSLINLYIYKERKQQKLND